MGATAYGFHSLRDVMASKITVAGVERVRDAVQVTTAEHTRQLNEMMAGVVQRTTKAKARFDLPTGGTLQPLDEYGNPKPVQTGDYYELGFPIQGGGTAYGTNRVSRAKMTVQQLNDLTLDVQRKDADWIMRHMLAAVLCNTNWTFTDISPEIGNVTVKPLANSGTGDTDKYAFAGGTVATDDHYLAQAAAIADGANPFGNIYKKLNEHPDNIGEYAVYVPTNLADAVGALTELVEKPDRNVVLGANSDTLTNDGSRHLRFGQRVIGYLKSSQMWAIEWKRLPSNYMLAVAPDGPTPPLRMREHEESELQGLFPEFASPDGNLELQKFIRMAGFGVFNRTGAVVQYIGGGAYVIPSGYTTPLAV